MNLIEKLSDFFFPIDRPELSIKNANPRPFETIQYIPNPLGTSGIVGLGKLTGTFNQSVPTFGRCYGIRFDSARTWNGEKSTVVDPVIRVSFDGVNKVGAGYQVNATGELILRPGDIAEFPRGADGIWLRSANTPGDEASGNPNIFQVTFVTDRGCRLIGRNADAPIGFAGFNQSNAAVQGALITTHDADSNEYPINVAGPKGAIVQSGLIAPGLAAGASIVATGPLEAGEYEARFYAYSTAAEQVYYGLRVAGVAPPFARFSLRVNPNHDGMQSVLIPRVAVQQGDEFAMVNGLVGATTSTVNAMIYYRRVA